MEKCQTSNFFCHCFCYWCFPVRSYGFTKCRGKYKIFSKC